MNQASLDWLLYSGQGLTLRASVGAAILAALAIADIRKNGRQATRWREYLFLVVAAAVALAYGAINDQVAASISWEYWWYGKGFEQQLHPLRAAPPGLRWEVFKYSLQASWTVGLLAGVVLLMANNPGKRPGAPRPLRLRRLYGLLPLLLAGPMLASAILGALGYAGMLAKLIPAIHRLPEEWRPARFGACLGVIWGAYLGGGLAALAAVVWVKWKRRTESGNI